METPKIGFVTCEDLSLFFVSEKNLHYTWDDQVAVDYLQEHGIGVEPVIWGESVEKIKARNLDMLIMRSPWDYARTPENRENFSAWLKKLKQARIPMQNPYDIMLWNLDKHYLADLRDKGVPIVETIFVDAPGVDFDLGKTPQHWPGVVVKPCISSGARDTFLLRSKEEVEAFKPQFAKLAQARDMLVQPFLPEVVEKGEWSLVFIDGEYCHSVLKKPKVGGWLVQDELGGSVHCLEPSQKIIAAAEFAYSKISRDQLLYARIDLIETSKGIVLGELELIEPELFFLRREPVPGSAKPRTSPQLSALIAFLRGIQRFLA